VTGSRRGGSPPLGAALLERTPSAAAPRARSRAYAPTASARIAARKAGDSRNA